VLLHDLDAAREQIEALRRLGVRVALDDFGVGFSSLSYLRSLPFDKVKIDRAFVSGLTLDPINHAIVRCIVSLARELDMKVTAEGVETEEEAMLLRAAGCDSLQGFHFGRPMPAAEIGARVFPTLHAATG
jgi:EAL domain-containing protein (putative c-di-GMP-specific phosphodiesterase class I)